MGCLQAVLFSVLLGTAAASDEPAFGAVLVAADRMAVEADGLRVSPDGSQVLLVGGSKVTLLSPEGTARAAVTPTGIIASDVADSGQFILCHDGGVTVHSPDQGREQLRLATMDPVVALAISPEGRRIAVAAGKAVTVHDAVSGKVLFSVPVAATAADFDGEGLLWITHDALVVGYDVRGRKQKGEGVMPIRPGLFAEGCPPGLGLCFQGPAMIRGDRVWVLVTEGKTATLERWRLLGPSDIDRADDVPEGDAVTALAWSAAKDLLVVHESGRLERTGADGSPLSVQIPDCKPCLPAAVGGAADGTFWAIGSAGAFQTWHPAGAPLFGRPKLTSTLAASRLADGRWAALATDGRPRIGGSPGKGRAGRAVVGAVGLHADGELVAVWSPTEVVLFDARGDERAVVSLGEGRKTVQAAVAPGGAVVAVLDDQAFLHLFQPDGRPVFRIPVAGAGSVLAWDPNGAVVYAGGEPLGSYRVKDGKEVVRVMVSNGGVREVSVSPDGRFAMLISNEDTATVARLRPTAVVPPE